MGASDKTPDLHPGNAVIAKLYSVVVDNNNLPELFSAWDEFVDKIFTQDPEEAKLWQTLLSEHFEQVSPLITIANPSLAEEKQDFVDRQSFPAILFNSCFRIVAKNTLADVVWPVGPEHDISSAALPPFNPQRILSMKENPEHADPVLISLDIGREGDERVTMAIIHPVQFRTGDGKSSELLYILRIAKPNWPQGLGKMLASTHGLTEAEIEVTKAVYENQTVNAIAKSRKRSVRTVRTQLSHIFDKIGATSQSELISMISNLAQILEIDGKQNQENPPQPVQKFSHLDAEMRSCKSPDGHMLSYAVYGDKSGTPVISLQPTIPPAMTEKYRRAAYDAGFCFFVPFKPGSGQSSSRNYVYTPEHAAKDYRTILNTEGLETVNVVGHGSGGIYALHFAKKYPESTRTITLVETGIPLRSAKDFMKMSAIARRTFLPARFFPNILLSPHKMVAKEFHQSDAGQKRIVHYFVGSNPIDYEKVKTDREYYNIIRDIISYSFEDVKQLVDNVCLWARNWEPLLLEVCNNKSVQFLHGEKNDVFLWSDIETFVNQHPNTRAVSMKNQSQLGVFDNPDALMNLLS